MQSMIEELRQKAVEDVLSLGSMRTGWDGRRRLLLQMAGNPPEGQRVLDIGDRLSEVFEMSTITGRTQGDLSRAGVAWEGLVCWYCNLCLIGTRAVVVKVKKSVVPEPLRKAVSVQISNTQTASEADLMAITFPDRLEYTQAPEAPQGSLKGRLDKLAEKHFDEYGLCIIQCKTNWNDMAQVPMLWDMIYRAADFKDSRIHVGSNGYNVDRLKQFRYAFVTVPTNDPRKYTASSLTVMRVRGLTGGNYWGREGISGIAHSVKEIFDRNFCDAFSGASIAKSLNEHIAGIGGRYAYFSLTG